MKRVLYAVAAVVAVLVFGSSVFAVSTQDSEQVRAAADQYLSGVPDNGYHLSADDVLKRLMSGSKDFQIVDVRDKIEKYNAGHIPGAIYINYKDIAKPENLAKLSRDKDIILYCNTGHEQNKAMSALRMLGYRAYALKFGYVAWKKEKPTEAMQKAIDNASQKSYPIEK